VFAELSQDDVRLRDELAAQITRICRTAAAGNLYLPLGAGQHLDHRVVFGVIDLCRQSIGHAVSIRFYEDVPYVFLTNCVKHRLRAIRAGVNGNGMPADLKAAPVLQEAFETCRSAAKLHFVAAQLTNPIAKAILYVVVLATFLGARRRKDRSNHLRLSAEVCDVSSSADRKTAVIEAYRSQLDLLLGGSDQWKKLWTEYSHAIGGQSGRYLERYWRVDRV
jgi:hypothetical protein